MKLTNTSPILFYIAAALLLCLPVQALAADLRLQSGASFDWWKDNNNSKASQLTIPVQITGVRDALSYRLTTGFTSTSLDTGSESVSMSGLLDTKVGATYRFSDSLPFELLLGIDFNLPTGQTNLSVKETLLIMDPDLLPVNSYGEGFNINPTITVAKGFDNWIFALGLGYLWRGAYDFSESLKDYQPGMVINTLAEARYQFTPQASSRLFAGYTLYGTDTADGDDYFKEGDLLQLGGSFTFAQQKQWNATAGLRGIFRGDVTQYDGNNKQNLNAYNGTEAVFDLGGSYFLDHRTRLSVPFQVRLIADNGYASDSPRFVGARQKISLGFGAAREIIPGSLTGELNLKGFYKHDDATMIPDEIEARTFTGLGISASLTGSF